MGRDRTPRDRKNYRIGIDVGTHSVGLAAIEVDDDGHPLSILSAISHIHDSGVLEAKTAQTRLAASGIARRMRRLRRRRVKRLQKLDTALASWGWVPLVSDGDPYQAWRARERLATERIAGDDERNALLATALVHMARHRGWRNPYVRVASMYAPVAPSAYFAGDTSKKIVGFKERVETAAGRTFPDDVTVAELAVAAIDHDRSVPLRMGKTTNVRSAREFSYLGGKLLQSDNANELHVYAQVQGIDEARLREIIDLVFEAESPRGSWVGRIGKDPLSNEPRAAKATDSFQRFRIVSVLGNVRLREDGVERKLRRDELQNAYDFLVNVKPGEQPTWGDVGDAIGSSRRALAGVASMNFEGEERLPQRPPILASDHVFRSLKKFALLRDFWVNESNEHRDAIVNLLVDGARDESTQAGVDAWELQQSMSEEELADLDKIDLPAGRGAYSVSSLRKLTDHMLAEGVDLHEARKAVFGVGDDWVPPSEPIGAPVGNPAVDRVVKIIARFVYAAEAEWGPPQRVVIEHVRNAFQSEASVRDADRENQKRFKAKLEERESVGNSVKLEGRVRDSDLRRFAAVQRQNTQCLYCGATITFDTCEMDHIVPRKGPGSTNTRVNLVAVCIPCNRDKSNLPFGVWAARSGRPGVSVKEAADRTKFWQRDNGMSPKSWSAFVKEVRDRLERTEEDPEIDARSMESVAWMANEVRDRIAAHFAGSNTNSGEKRVFVYRGAITADARRVTGVEGRIPWIGGGGKTRLDRRHHAVDAAVLTLVDESIARSLAERDSMRMGERAVNAGVESWKTYEGNGPSAKARFAAWKQDMEGLASLLTTAFTDDTVVVTENLRLRLGNGQAHEDTIRPLVRRLVGGALTRDEIDAASSPQLWTALTRDPDFDEQNGLPENGSRHLRVRGKHFNASDEIAFFDKPRAAIEVRDGWARIGVIHHARFYRWEERGKVKYGMLRVFGADLVKHRHEDLFTVAPHPSWVSMRAAHPSIGRADLSTKEYLGWVVPGDEVRFETNPPEVPLIGEITRWKVSGYENNMTLNVKPLAVAAEGIDRFLDGRGNGEGLRKLLEGKGLRESLNSLLSKSSITIIRRDSLGRPRHHSPSNLPTCWSTK